MALQTSSARITVAGYEFEGPYTTPAKLRDAPGVYVILDQRTDSKWYVLDVGESEEMKTRIENHDRKTCWTIHSLGTIGYAALYTPGWTGDQRRALEKQIRDRYNPPCGQR